MDDGMTDHMCDHMCDHSLELTVGDYLDMVDWYTHLPVTVQEMFTRFPPGTVWRVRTHALSDIHDNDWFMPEGFRPDGTLDMAWFSQAGLLLGHVLGVKATDLIPMRGH